MAVAKDIIKKGGAWFTYGDNRVQGRDGMKKLLQENDELQNKIETEVRKALGFGDIQDNGTEENENPSKKSSK